MQAKPNTVQQPHFSADLERKRKKRIKGAKIELKSRRGKMVAKTAICFIPLTLLFQPHSSLFSSQALWPVHFGF